MTLRISDTLELPLDFTTATLAILAQKGKGKSYTASVIAEELLEAGQPVVIIDPTGAWWGLRSSADGAGAGYPIAVLGGDHGDVPLEATAGEVIANAIVTERFSAVIDLSLFTKGEELRFLSAFLETLYRKNREALHLVIDEADVVAPQRPMGEDARTLGACQNIVRRGRIRGLGCTLITQRPQVLNKDVLSQADMLCVLGMNHPKDLGAIDDWVSVHADVAVAKRMIASLPKLPRGQAWWWWPTADVFDQITIRRRRTFDSGATPKPGQRAAIAKVLAEVDIARLGAAIAATVERAKETDTKALRAELARVKAQLEVASAAQIPREVEAELARLRGIEEYFREFRDMLRVHARDIARDLEKRVEAADSDAGRTPRTPMPPPADIKERLERMPPLKIDRAAFERAIAPPAPAPAAGPGDPTLRTVYKRILNALAPYPAGRTKKQVALLAGYAHGGGSFNRALTECRSSSWLTGESSELRITDTGRTVIGPVDPLPAAGRELREYWLRSLDNKCEREIVRTLAGESGAVSKAFLAMKSGYEAGGGSFNRALTNLRTLGLIEGKAKISLAEELV